MKNSYCVLVLGFGVLGYCSAGTESKIQPMIRDTSWPQSIVYDVNAYYEYLPEQSLDKITIRETTAGSLGYFLALVVPALPRQWNPCVTKVANWHLDLFDALSIGAKDANPLIVQKSLEKLPYTKLGLANGKVTDFISPAYTVDGKFKIDTVIDDACDMMIIRINRMRFNKTASMVSATCLFASTCSGLVSEGVKSTFEKLAFCLLKGFADSAVLVKAPASSKDFSEAKFDAQMVVINRALASGLTISALLTHRLQQKYIEGFIKVLGLLTTHYAVAFDRAEAYKKIKAVKDKLVWFGVSCQQAEAVQKILNNLEKLEDRHA